MTPKPKQPQHKQPAATSPLTPVHSSMQGTFYCLVLFNAFNAANGFYLPGVAPREVNEIMRTERCNEFAAPSRICGVCVRRE